MRSRLFLKIYLTLLASLVIVAVGSALLVRIGQDDEDRGWAGRRDRFIADMLPAGDDPAVLSATLDRLSDALDADIAVYGPDRRLIAGSRLIAASAASTGRIAKPGARADGALRRSLPMVAT